MYCICNCATCSEAYIYKPPSQQDVIRKGRRAKHIEHYIGPGRIVRHIGTRSVVVVIKDDNTISKEYQHDAGMVLLKKGELIILKDDPEAKDWYCAEVRDILADRIEVYYFTTQTSALEEHGKCTVRDRKEWLSEALFLRTWCHNGGKDNPTTTPPSTKYARMNHLW